MIRRPPRSTPLYSSAASDVYKRQMIIPIGGDGILLKSLHDFNELNKPFFGINYGSIAVSYTHLRAHETKANLVCRLLLEKKKKKKEYQKQTKISKDKT